MDADTRPVVGIEISPCRDDGTSTYPTTVADAQFWTVYLRREEDDFVISEALVDCDTQTAAEARALRLCVEHNTVLPISTMSPDYAPPRGLYTAGQVAKALDAAWDAISEAAGLTDGVRDALNLLGHATEMFLTGEDVSLSQVVAKKYDKGVTLRKLIRSIENPDH